jgi:hypothetical protein
MPELGEGQFQRLLRRFAIERFLYRLGRSPDRERFVLKGLTRFLARLAQEVASRGSEGESRAFPRAQSGPALPVPARARRRVDWTAGQAPEGVRMAMLEDLTGGAQVKEVRTDYAVGELLARGDVPS